MGGSFLCCKILMKGEGVYMSEMKNFEIDLKDCFMFACDMYYDFKIRDGDEEYPYVFDLFEDPEAFGEALEDGLGLLILPLWGEVEEYEKEVGKGAYYKVTVLDEGGRVWGVYQSENIDWE